MKQILPLLGFCITGKFKVFFFFCKKNEAGPRPKRMRRGVSINSWYTLAAGRFRRLADCLAREMACKEHESYVWWDLGNPTEAVNVLLAVEGTTTTLHPKISF